MKKEKQEKQENQEVVKTKKSFKETVTLMFRRKWLTNAAQTALIVAILVAAFLAINIYAQSLDLPEIDVTENKIYTLSDASKEVIAKIDEKVKIYVYGFEEKNTLISFIKQYIDVNENISYEILTEESNLAKVQEFELSEGYQILVLETESSSKIIDTSNEFYTYDYTTGQEVDLTEQTLTNSLLAITTENKPKVYFTEGHKEYALTTEMTVLDSYLKNEAYNVENVNLLTTGKVPDDCNLLVIMAPVQDFIEAEVNFVLDYINKGGDLIITTDVGNLAETYPNLQRIYDAYGVSLNHSGYVYETSSSKILSNYPNIFMPEMSASNPITQDIYTDGAIWLVYAGRLEFVSDDLLASLNVTRDDIITSSEDALFIKDVTTAAENATDTAEEGQSIIGSVLTKTISEAVEATDSAEGQEAVESNALFMANASFITDYKVAELSETYPMSYLANNKDFMLNAISHLTEREDTLKIRKDMSNATYTPSEAEHAVVLTIIFAVPILIIILGVIVGILRKRKR